MAPRNERIGQILLSRRLITEAQLRQALSLQAVRRENLGSILLECGYVSEEMLVRALAAQAGVQPWNLKTDPPSEQALALLPFATCSELGVIPVQVRNDLLLLAMKDPRNTATIEKVRKITNLRIEPVMVHEPRLTEVLMDIASGKQDPRTLDSLVIKALGEVDRTDGSATGASDIHSEVDTRPVVGLVNKIIADAIRKQASDVHIEPRENRVEIRFRLDGQLVPIDDFPSELLPMVVTRIKIMSNLDIVEFRQPQDGRLAVKLDGRQVDMRVAVLPNFHGPRIVLRLHDRTAALLPLSSLGFDNQLLSPLVNLLQKPYGMVLISGPTGSGKTTTLYSAIKQIRKDSTNIMTVEDPIEYDLPGVSQSQVNEKIGLTFANQLRAILRQDPDVVMIGEIRDRETAEIALRAAMTGHLVLSTVHTNDAISAIPRLIDIGLPPFLLSSSLIGVASQRLVRKVCESCCEDHKPDDEEKALLDRYGFSGNLRKAVGCADCYQTGYRGRAAVGELVTVDRHMASLISEGASMESMRALMTDNGFRSIQTDALKKVAQGITTLEEVRRLVFFEDKPDTGHTLKFAA